MTLTATPWHPHAERIAGNNAGTMDGDGSRKLLLHSTEGGTIAGAVAAYTANNSWPTLTVDMPERRIAQHNPADVAARALRNLSGGVQTNREGTILIQVEIVGFATNPASLGSDDDWAWFGREVVAWAAAWGVPLAHPEFMAYPASYGNSAVRMSGATWDAYSGILGHQHAAENAHGDPGAVGRQVDIAIAHAGGDLFTMAQYDDIMTRLDKLEAKQDRTLASLTRVENTRFPKVLEETAALRSLAERIRTQLDTNVDRSVADRLIDAATRIESELDGLKAAIAALTPTPPPVEG